MKRVRLVTATTIFSLAIVRVATAQRSSEPTGSNFHKVAVVDSADLRVVGASPDGRWLTYAYDQAIWIMPADGRAKATRLLPPGFIDRNPVWFPGSDRLGFVSNRAARDGSKKLYGMTVSIDPNTGRAQAPPRQVTTEETPGVGGVSPDGQWMTYVVPEEKAIKIVPSTGGTPRTLVTMDRAHLPLIWSRDGKTIYFAVGGAGNGVPPYGVWHKVASTGGAVVRAYKNAMAMPYAPNPDRHVVIVPRDADGRDIQRVELYDANDRLLGTADMAPGMTPAFPLGSRDGMYGMMSNRRYENYLVSLNDGATRMMSSPPWSWINGWASDGAGLVVDGSEPGKPTIGVLDTSGRLSAQVALPLDVRASGWEGVVGTTTTFRRGARPEKPDDPSPLFIADPRTGTTGELAPRALEGRRVRGRGAGDVDGNRFLVTVPNGAQLELRAFTLDGRSTLVRSFARTDSILATAVHGDRVAWGLFSRDSLIVFTARGPAGRARRLGALRRVSTRVLDMGWSFDGTMLAVSGESLDDAIAVMRVDDDGALRGVITVLKTRAAGIWGLRWTTDDRALLVIGTPTGSRMDQVIRVSVDPEDPPAILTRMDEWIGDNVHVAPDGKRMAFPLVRTLGSSIWRVDFNPPGKASPTSKP
jgi:Tol biopolymer transport system component